MDYLFILGRQPKISLAELEALFGAQNIRPIADHLTVVKCAEKPNFSRLGGSLKCAEILSEKPLDYLRKLESGKITLAFSDYSPKASQKSSWAEAMKYKKLLTRHGRSVRLIPNKDGATISAATAIHNHLGHRKNHIEIIRYKGIYASTIATQNIDAYAQRDHARPARDAFVGMLPPKLAQILINLATEENSSHPNKTLLDPFCGTGVVLQEALLNGYHTCGSDLSEKMIDYTNKNLNWLRENTFRLQQKGAPSFQLEPGDATTHQWAHKIDFVASEIYLGHPLSAPPSDKKLKELKNDAKTLLLAFLANISPQISPKTTLALAIPAWARPNGSYSTLDILDEIEKLAYNVVQYQFAQADDLLYHRDGQIVARQIIVLRKK